jgi:hypothetical protein
MSVGNLPTLFAPMTLIELVEYMRGHILIEIGKGQYEQAVYTAMSIAWEKGYLAGVQQQAEAQRK